MIPDNPDLIEIDDYNKHLTGAYLHPDDKTLRSPLEDYELGGVAIQDPSQGLTHQNWYGYWDAGDETVYLVPDNTEIPIPIFTQADVVEFVFSFDQNMRWTTLTRDSNDVMYHRWYDSSVESYVTTTYNDVTSMRITLDDKRAAQVQGGVTDNIITYIQAGTLKWRIQRDRFLVEYSYPGQSFGPVFYISNFGMNRRLRLQWRIGFRRT